MTSRDRPRSRRLRLTVLVAVSAASAGAWVAIRMPTARGVYRDLVDICAQVDMRSTDWPCTASAARTTALYLAAAAFASLAVLVPTVVLAVRGRRALAFTPLLAAPVAVLVSDVASWIWSGTWVTPGRSSTSAIFVGPWSSGAFPGGSAPPPWRPDDPLAIVVDLAILATPVIAYQALFRPVRAARWAFGWRSALLVVAIAVGGSVALGWLIEALTSSELIVIGGWVPQGLVVLAFGLLLPCERGAPRWAIAPAAILASLGPATLFEAAISGYTAFTWFRTAVPLALMGFVAVASVALVSQQRGARPSEPPEGSAPTPAPTRRVRPATIASGLAAGALVLTVLMAMLDPLPVDLATSLPTFLGARLRVDDLRTRMTLDQALGEAAAFRSEEGSFEGFDAAVAVGRGSRLLWEDGLPPEEATFGPELVVRVVEAEGDRLALLLVGDVTTYCVRTTGRGGTTFGTGTDGHVIDRARAALDACGADPWIDDLLRPFPVEELCEPVVQPSITMCRGVQRRLRDILASPTGTS